MMTAWKCRLDSEMPRALVLAPSLLRSIIALLALLHKNFELEVKV